MHTIIEQPLASNCKPPFKVWLKDFVKSLINEETAEAIRVEYGVSKFAWFSPDGTKCIDLPQVRLIYSAMASKNIPPSLSSETTVTA